MKIFLQSCCLLLLLSFQLTSRAQAPLLNSYPSAAAVIFLDFDGHTVNGTSWNYNGPIVCGASGLNNTQITEIFNRVAEDYRPFNINITTDSAKFLAAPANRRMRVVLTVSSSWYGSAGGVAFVSSFSWGDDNPCFVFTALLNYNVKNVAEAASHEAGHTLGLYHQASYNGSCGKVSDYNQGVGDGEIGWAPIMGVGYYRNFTLWNNGPNSFGCSSMQSDLDIITSATNGFGYRKDDHGNLFDSSTISVFSNNQFTASGVIERNTDQDIFKFIMPASGRFKLNAIPYNVGTGNSGSDLDMQVTLYDESQTAVGTYNPGTLLNSVIDTLLNGGAYYIKVEGKGNLYAPSYASLGSYSMQATVETISSAILQVNRLELHGAQNGDKHQLNWAIDADQPIKQQFLEVSTDGKDFNVLTEIDKDILSYNYSPGTHSVLHYRVQVTFNNNSHYYSNIITLRDNNTAPRPKLISTVINTGNIYVSSPGYYSFAIFDMSDRIISRGRLSSGINNINAGNLVPGMYIIRFSDNNRCWSEKLLRQ